MNATKFAGQSDMTGRFDKESSKERDVLLRGFCLIPMVRSFSHLKFSFCCDSYKSDLNVTELTLFHYHYHYFCYYKKTVPISYQIYLFFLHVSFLTHHCRNKCKFFWVNWFFFFYLFYFHFLLSFCASHWLLVNTQSTTETHLTKELHWLISTQKFSKQKFNVTLFYFRYNTYAMSVIRKCLWKDWQFSFADFPFSLWLV